MSNSRKWFPSKKKRTQSVVKRSYEAPYWYQDIEDAYLKALEKRAELDEEIADLRMQLFDAMKDDNLKRLGTDRTEVVIIRSYDGRRVDSGKLRNKYPVIFEECSNPYTMPSHLQITVKKD